MGENLRKLQMVGWFAAIVVLCATNKA